MFYRDYPKRNEIFASVFCFSRFKCAESWGDARGGGHENVLTFKIYEIPEHKLCPESVRGETEKKNKIICCYLRKLKTWRRKEGCECLWVGGWKTNKYKKCRKQQEWKFLFQAALFFAIRFHQKRFCRWRAVGIVLCLKFICVSTGLGFRSSMFGDWVMIGALPFMIFAYFIITAREIRTLPHHPSYFLVRFFFQNYITYHFSIFYINVLSLKNVSKLY